MTIYNMIGFGKGKTTSAMGISLRALGNGESVLFIQFLKDGKDKGIDLLKTFPNFTHIAQGTQGFTLEDCSSFYEEVVNTIISGDKTYDLIVYDELNVVLDYNLLNVELVLSRIKDSIPDVYLTGRINNHDLRHRMYDICDIVTNCYCEAHPFNRTCKKCGIDWNYHYEYCPVCGDKLSKSPKAKKGREF